MIYFIIFLLILIEVIFVPRLKHSNGHLFCFYGRVVNKKRKYFKIY